jgi:tetratricopeptide (TPR) repeat protein
MDPVVRRHRTALFVAAIIAAAALAPRPLDQRPVPSAVDLYQAGDWRRALDSFDTETLTAGQFTSALDAWIGAAGAPSESRRSLVAAAFALDAVWMLTRRWAHINFPEPPPDARASLGARQSLGVIATWAARQVPTVGAATGVERAVWLAAVGVAQDACAWPALHTEILPLARKRVPDDPRLRLATVLASANVDLGPLDFWTIRNLNSSALRQEDLPSKAASRIPGAIRSLEALLTEASLAGEVELRIGYLELRRRHWPDALARFEASRQRTRDQTLLATADYLAGWVHEQRGQPNDAIAAYRRALILAPMMRSLATRLSALLFLRDERTEAYAILDRALNARPIPVDLVTSLKRGDGRFVGEWLATVRQGVRQVPGF